MIHDFADRYDVNESAWVAWDIANAAQDLTKDIEALDESGEYPHSTMSYEMFIWLKEYNIPPTVFLEQPEWIIKDIRYFRKLEALISNELWLEKYKPPQDEAWNEDG